MSRARSPLSLVHSAAPSRAAESNDVDLVQRVLRGERLAEELLYRRHGPTLLAVAMRLLGRKAEAEDVLQETFVRGFERVGQLRDPSLVRSWLAQIAVNLARKQLRKRKLWATLGLDRGDDDASLTVLADKSVSPESRAELAQIDRWIAALPAEQRVAWMLRHVEGWTLEEVADACGYSLATAKRRIKEAEDSLAAKIEGRR